MDSERGSAVTVETAATNGATVDSQERWNRFARHKGRVQPEATGSADGAK